MKTTTDPMFAAEVMLNDRPSVIKFEASWCHPCKAMQPALEQIEDTLDGVVDFFKIDVEKLPQTAAALNISQVPMLVAVKDGLIVGMKAGAAPRSQLEGWVRSALAL